MAKILYISHVSWRWIKQRPQFLAEELSKYHEVFYLDYDSLFSFKSNLDTSIIFPKVPRLPLERFGIIKVLNRIIISLYFYFFLKKFDLIWVTAPSDIASLAIKNASARNKIVYDCMDDMLEFSTDSKVNAQIQKRESCLYKKSDLVIASSEYLKNKIQTRYGEREICVINNAVAKISDVVEGKVDFLDSISRYLTSKKKSIVYVGTIAEWIDVSLVKKITESIPEIEFYFFGPCRAGMEEKLTMESVYLMGSVSHEFVSPILQKADALIMPFEVTELILSVNPVKLYEYIASGTPCFAPYYGESKQFGEYIYLYKSHDECLQLLSRLAGESIHSKRTIEECQSYIRNNTWANRCTQICKKLNDVLEKQ